VLAFGNLKPVAVMPLQLACELPAFVPGVSNHRSDVWEGKTHAPEQAIRGLMIRDIRWLNPVSDRKSARIDQDMPLAPP
jgi:hypothetical protein